MDKKLKDLKDEVLVVTNAAEGNTPHVVEDIESALMNTSEFLNHMNNKF